MQGTGLLQALSIQNMGNFRDFVRIYHENRPKTPIFDFFERNFQALGTPPKPENLRFWEPPKLVSSTSDGQGGSLGYILAM